MIPRKDLDAFCSLGLGGWLIELIESAEGEVFGLKVLHFILLNSIIRLASADINALDQWGISVTISSRPLPKTISLEPSGRYLQICFNSSW